MSKKWTKTDLFIIGILFALLVSWGPLFSLISRKTAPPAPPAAPTNAVATVAGKPSELTAPEEPAAAPPAEPAPAPAEPVAAPPAVEAPAVEPGLVTNRLAPENVAVMSNAFVRLGLSRLGGGIVFAELAQFPVSPRDSSPLVLDFAADPALSLVALPSRGASPLSAFTADQPYDIRVSEDRASAVLTARNRAGLTLQRTFTLTNDYRVAVEDRFINESASAADLPEYGVQAGSLLFPPGSGMSQGTYLGIDTLSSSGVEDVRHWGSSSFFNRKEQLSDFFLPSERRGGGCDMFKPALAQPLPKAIRQTIMERADWLSVKNKFFTQILVPEGGSAGFTLGAQRLVPPQENPALPRSWSTAPLINGVSAVMILDPVHAEPGETVTRRVAYYVGPKEYQRIESMGNKMVDIMEFGKYLRPICWVLLVTLKGLYAVIPNYGIAIILLTILIRLVFWPITHKSTESMRRMQEVQPQIALLREKYKDKPQKLQEETMKLYKEKKVNPVGGCLPMLIQIPVFIALFNVLRSGVELRYADFLWIADLSEPEGLFAGVLPIAINILPLIMTATSVWQSYLTPSGGDPSQQKMMMLMPVMMLFLFYNMPAALVLYWTVNQVLMIVQLLWQRRMKAKAAA